MVWFLGGSGSGSTSSTPSSVKSASPAPSDSCELVPKPADPTAAKKEVNPLNPTGIKPCCACPETKSARDDCFLKSSPEEAGENCKALVEAHKACMRSYGFKV